MAKLFSLPSRCVVLLLVLFGCDLVGAETVRVATYNVENYLDQPTESRPRVKSDQARARIRESIHALNPDVIALEEIGSVSALMELRASLKNEGADFPDWEFVSGMDTNVHVAVLSKLPIVARHAHTNETYLLDGRRFCVSRGFAEVEIRVNTNFTFTLIVAHLKSRRPVPEADEAEQRLAEAGILRGIVDGQLTNQPDAKLIVLGDFNDVKDSDAVKAIIGRGRFKLTDTRPTERNGDNSTSEDSRFEPRNVTWTEYYAKEDTYSRMDYILLSPAMARDWLPNETYVLAQPNWGIGSDHRPIVAALEEK